MSSMTRRWSAGLLSGRPIYLTLALLSLGFAIAMARDAGSQARETAPAAEAVVANSSLPPSANAAQSQKRLREGTVLVDMVGHFKRTGERATFYKSGSKHGMGVLENLNLQRVIEGITVNSDQLAWVVSGTVTEFKNRNYLLIDRVVLKNSVE